MVVIGQQREAGESADFHRFLWTLSVYDSPPAGADIGGECRPRNTLMKGVPATSSGARVEAIAEARLRQDARLSRS
jgi:hypothetical protein